MLRRHPEVDTKNTDQEKTGKWAIHTYDDISLWIIIPLLHELSGFSTDPYVVYKKKEEVWPLDVPASCWKGHMSNDPDVATTPPSRPPINEWMNCTFIV